LRNQFLLPSKGLLKPGVGPPYRNQMKRSAVVDAGMRKHHPCPASFFRRSTPALLLVVGWFSLQASWLQMVARAQEVAEQAPPPPQDNICYIGDGAKQYEFQNGESLGNLFLTRCSNTPSSSSSFKTDNENDNKDAVPFPCFCNTNKYPNVVDCPYCGFETNELEDNNGLFSKKLVCARHDETIEFVNVDGIAQSCTCHVPLDGITAPIPNCKPIVEDTPEQQQKYCILELANGTVVTVAHGASFGTALETQCSGGGSLDYPCFCNTTLPGRGIECPYCPLLDYSPLAAGTATAAVTTAAAGAATTSTAATSTAVSIGTSTDPFLICARDGETVLLTDASRVDQFHCTCSIPDDPLTSSPHAECILITSSPSRVPSEAPTITPSLLPTSNTTTTTTNTTTIPPNNATNTTTTTTILPSLAPSSTSQSPSSFITDQPTPTLTLGRPPSPISILPPAFAGENERGCFVNSAMDGTLVFVKAGDSLGDLVPPGPCGTSELWPTFCNPDLPGGNSQEYPYCIFLARTKHLVDDNNEAMVASLPIFDTENNIFQTTTTTTTTTTVVQTELVGGEETTTTTTTTTVVEKEEETSAAVFDDDTPQRIVDSILTSDSQRNEINTNTNGNNNRYSGREIICARNGEQVSFVAYPTNGQQQQQDEEQECGCLYLSASIGALSSCPQWVGSSFPPTSSPTDKPTTMMTNDEDENDPESSSSSSSGSGSGSGISRVSRRRRSLYQLQSQPSFLLVAATVVVMAV
jgi:hypothetical protein